MIDVEFVVLIMGGLFTVIGVIFQIKGWNLMNNGKTAEAFVHKYEKRTDPDYTSLYYPVVRFKTENLEWITQELETGTNPPLYNEGEKITIIYDPDDPTRLDIFSLFRLRVLPWIFLGLGVTLLIVGVLITLDLI